MLTDSKVYDIIEFISLNREFLKQDLRNDAVKYLVDVYNAHPLYFNTFKDHFPKYIIRKLLNNLSDIFKINAEDVEVLIPTLLNNDDIRNYFCESYSYTARPN